jgi:hypothetical protein
VYAPPSGNVAITICKCPLTQSDHLHIRADRVRVLDWRVGRRLLYGMAAAVAAVTGCLVQCAQNFRPVRFNRGLRHHLASQKVEPSEIVGWTRKQTGGARGRSTPGRLVRRSEDGSGRKLFNPASSNAANVMPGPSGVRFSGGPVDLGPSRDASLSNTDRYGVPRLPQCELRFGRGGPPSPWPRATPVSAVTGTPSESERVVGYWRAALLQYSRVPLEARGDPNSRPQSTRKVPRRWSMLNPQLHHVTANAGADAPGVCGPASG